MNGYIIEPTWLRQAFEGDREWSYFEAYRALPAYDRHLGKLLAHGSERAATLEQWAVRYFWVERAAEYDRYLDRATVGAIVVDRTVAAVRKESLETIANMHHLLAGEVKVYLRKQAELAATGQAIELFKPHEMIRALREVVLLGRLLMGESTENVQLSVPVDRLTDDELRFLSDIQAKLASDAPAILTEGNEVDP